MTRFDAALAALVEDLMDTLDATPGRAGVAAPQIGVGSRVFCYDVEGSRGYLVNPTITKRAGETVDLEACLSVPGMAYPTPRPARVIISGFDLAGTPVTLTGSGQLARLFEHETDHLDGVLYVDRLRGETRRRATRAIRAIRSR